MLNQQRTKQMDSLTSQSLLSTRSIQTQIIKYIQYIGGDKCCAGSKARKQWWWGVLMRHHLRTVLWEGRLAERWEEWQGGGNSSVEALKQGSVSAVSTVGATWRSRHLQKFLLFPIVTPHRFSLPSPWCDVTPPSSASSLETSEPVSFL